MSLPPQSLPIPAAAAETLPEDIVEVLQNGDYSGVFRKAIYDLESDHRRFWAGEHTPDGVPWFPLAESTVKRKGHDTILVETGKLRRSMTAGLVTSNGESIREIVDEGANKGFSFGTAVPYGSIHQQGGGKIPQR
jgi:hypothetical protein